MDLQAGVGLPGTGKYGRGEDCKARIALGAFNQWIIENGQLTIDNCELKMVNWG